MGDSMHLLMDFAVLNHDDDLYGLCLLWADRKLDGLHTHPPIADTMDVRAARPSADSHPETLALARQSIER